MLKVERTAVLNIENAMRGARNPLNSWAKSDSYYNGEGEYILGENDRSLASRLCHAGSDHRKFIRQIFVCCDITAPLYWWKEFDTYKVGTVANSTSTMHKIHAKPIEREDFSCDRLGEGGLAALDSLIAYLEETRLAYIDTKDKKYWHELIQLLPSSYNQMRTVTMNYENLVSMYYARKSHKLPEWHVFCDWVRGLPYFDLLIAVKEEQEA